VLQLDLAGRVLELAGVGRCNQAGGVFLSEATGPHHLFDSLDEPRASVGPCMAALPMGHAVKL
jgi:hypothetical protein